MAYLTDKQMAERFSVTRQTVWRWTRAVADFPRPVTLTPGCTRWRLQDVERWEASRAGKGAA